MALIEIGLIIGIILFCILVLVIMYRVVPPSEAHVVTTPSGQFVASPDPNVAAKCNQKGIKTWYFYIPIIRTVRIINMTTQEINFTQQTWEEKRARYDVQVSMKFKPINPKVAAETWISIKDLKGQINNNIQSAVRAVTNKHDVEYVMIHKSEVDIAIKEKLQDDLEQWGLKLLNVQLVDFQDAKNHETGVIISTIISDISKRREVEIETETRELNAEKYKQAKIKEADANEAFRTREIARDKVIKEKEQDLIQEVAIREQEAKTEEYKVTQIETIRQAEINKEQAIVIADQKKEVAIVLAKQEKETEEINKEQKLLEGEGDRMKAEEQAKADAAPIRETGTAQAEIIKLKGFADAEVKDKLQEALNKFKDAAIKALTAEMIVNKDETVGVALAQAIEKSDTKIFAGGQSAEDGFKFSQLLSATNFNDADAGNALANRIAKPNDLGFKALGAQAANEIANKTEVKKVNEIGNKPKATRQKKNKYSTYNEDEDAPIRSF